MKFLAGSSLIISLIGILHRYAGIGKYKHFETVKNVRPENLLPHLRNEHPQTIACVLSYLKPKKSAYILQNLTDDMQSEVTKRIAVMNKVNPEIAREVENVLVKKLSVAMINDYKLPGGVDRAGKILNAVADKALMRQILENIKKDDLKLAEKLEG